MAFTKILIISLFAAVQAGFARQDFDRFKPFQMNHMFYPTPPRAPFLPGFGQMMMPTPPFNFGHMMMPTPPFPPAMLYVPTPAEMASIQPGPGREFNGMSSSSTSGVTRDKDGNLVRTGGTTVVVNRNGNVHKMEVGDNPPDINKPIVIPPFHHFEMPEMPEFKPMKMHEFKPFEMPKMEPIIFDPIVPDDYVPSKDEHYTSVSKQNHFETKVINGVASSSGGEELAVNIDGELQHEKREFTDDNKKEMKKKREEEKNKKRNENKKQKKRGDDDDVKVDDE